MKKKKMVVIGLWISLGVLMILLGCLVICENTADLKNLVTLNIERDDESAFPDSAKISALRKQKEKDAEAKAQADAKSKDKEKTEAEPEAEKEKYTFADMEATYYAQSKATVREEPDDMAEVVGTLSLDTRVSVVGKCNETDYYKIKINGDYGYVSFEDVSEEYISIPLPTGNSKAVPSATKDILFIGNSITLYPATKDWWGSGWGCGATAPENDYVHQTVAAKGYSSFDYMSLRSWEFSNTRNYELDDLDPYITKYQYGIIVIELGENVKGHEDHFKEDLTDMIAYIKTYNPNARIVMLDNFWPYKSIISTKKAVASENGLTYVSLSDIQGVKDYQLQQGEQYTTPDGTVYTIGSFLAGHPNDAGFSAIAQHLISAL